MVAHGRRRVAAVLGRHRGALPPPLAPRLPVIPAPRTPLPRALLGVGRALRPELGGLARGHPKVVDQFLACGLLEHGFARIRYDTCAREYLLAFSCRCRYFCPSCHAKHLARWSLWLDDTPLAPVPHRQVVLTLAKRLRVYCLYRRAARGLAPGRRPHRDRRWCTPPPARRTYGIIACPQIHGSLANWHPHLHLVVTDGGFRPTGPSCAGPGGPRMIPPS